MESKEFLFELIKAIIQFCSWPLVVLVIAFFYREFITSILPKKDFEINLPGGIKMTLTSKEAKDKLAELFSEFHNEYQTLLKPQHRKFFEDILSRKSDKPLVNELIKKHFGEDFNHDNRLHIGTLRALRGLGLIRPAGGGEWTGESTIEITKFGIAFTEKLRREDIV